MTGYVDPDRAQFDLFKGLNRDTPLNMLNLVRMRDRAEYPSGHENAGKGLTGAEAYRLYGKHSLPVITRLGVSILWRGTFEAMLIGPEDERWDAVFIARYPNAHAFLEMISDPVYKAAVVHRQAAVETSRLIRCGDLPTDAGFA